MLFAFGEFFYWLHSPVTWVIGVFQIWMLIDAIRRQEWVWAMFIFFFPGFGAFGISSQSIAARPPQRADSNCPALTTANASRNCRRRFIISTRRTTIRN